MKPQRLLFSTTVASLFVCSALSAQVLSPNAKILSNAQIPGQEQRVMNPTQRSLSKQAGPRPLHKQSTRNKKKISEFSGMLVGAACMVEAEKIRPEAISESADSTHSNPATPFPHTSPQAQTIPDQDRGVVLIPGHTKPPSTATHGEHLPSGAGGVNLPSRPSEGGAGRAANQCPPTHDTQNFGLVTTGGKFYKFDEQGNLKARHALKVSNVHTGEIEVRVEGKLNGDILEVVELQIASRRRYHLAGSKAGLTR